MVLLRRLILSSVAPLFVAGVALAQGASPFAEFEGRWSGSGTITHGDGRTERLRCTANANGQKVFNANADVESNEPAGMVAAMNTSFAQIVSEVVPWLSERLNSVETKTGAVEAPVQ
mgnify:FL=1